MEGEEGGEGGGNSNSEASWRVTLYVSRYRYKSSWLSKYSDSTWQFGHLYATFTNYWTHHPRASADPLQLRRKTGICLVAPRAVYVRVAAPHDWCLARLFDFARRWCTINQQENINSASRRVTALLGDGLMARARRRPFDISPTRKSRSLASFSRAADCQPMSWYLRKQIFWT